jgi:hypothetical protein
VIRLLFFCVHVKGYEEYYEGEEEINRQLNVFAVNMKVAYGGVNDVQTQIGFSSKIRKLKCQTKNASILSLLP